MTTIALIACCKKKLATPALVLAADLYQGQLFRAQLAYARTKFSDQQICIASAKYELVRLDHELMPYELSLADLTKEGRMVWARRLVWQLKNIYGHSLNVQLMVGGLYQRILTPVFSSYSIAYEVPHPPETGYGQQVKWYQTVGVKVGNDE